jgi:hypothetical protein
MDPALLAEMYQVPGAPQRDQGYGLGVALAHAGDIPVQGHGGGGFGFLSDIYWAPQAEIGVVVLTNSTNHPLQWQLANDIFRDIIRTRPHRSAPSPKPVTVPTMSMVGMAGDYAGRGDDRVTFAVDGDRGFLIRGGTRHPVEFIGPHEFRIEQVPQEQYRFRDPDEAGRPTYLESSNEGFVRYRNDVPEPEPADAEGPWNRYYAIRVCGVRDGTARLRKENGLLCFDHWGGGTLRLREHAPGLYVSATGEILDLTRTPPTYANVRLHQH